MTLDPAGLEAAAKALRDSGHRGGVGGSGLDARTAVRAYLTAAGPPTGGNPDGPMTEALWKHAQNEWGWGADDYEACRDAITAVVAAGRAAATPDPRNGCRAPHCFSEYGTPCGNCPVAEKPETDT